MTVLDVMKAATPLVRRVTLCLDGTLQAEYDGLLGALTEAAFKDKTEQSLAADNVAKVVRQIERVRDKMLASEVSFSFKALPWFRRMELQSQHPPRDGNLVDRGSGYNVETYIPALIRECCTSVQGADKKVVTEIPDEHWDHLFSPDGLNFKQVDDLFEAAQNANDSATSVPPSARSLLVSQDSGASSKQPGPGTSPPSVSKAGSPRARRSSSTTKKAASSA
jgi:hypothetical protein